MVHGHGIHDLALVGGITVAGYYLGAWFHHHRLPGILGWMLFGILFGPSVAGLLTVGHLHSMAFVGEITLGLAAFSIGTELRLPAIRALGTAVVAIMVCQSLAAFAVVFAAVYLLSGDTVLALYFAAVAPATSPAGTMAVIQECRARGPLTTALFAAVGVDDGLTVVIYAFAAAFARDMLTFEAEHVSPGPLYVIGEPLLQLLAAVLIGLLVGLAATRLLSSLPEPSSILLVLFGLVLVASGTALSLGASIILANLVVGAVYANGQISAGLGKVARQLRLVMPLCFVIFYGLAGAHLHLAALPTLGAIGVVYVVARSLGLVIGSRLGARIGGVSDVIKRYLGPGILTQAGVAIGLALIAADYCADIGSPHAVRVGTTLLTTVTATSVVFEIVGPLLTKYALERAGEIGAAPED